MIGSYGTVHLDSSCKPYAAGNEDFFAYLVLIRGMVLAVVA